MSSELDKYNSVSCQPTSSNLYTVDVAVNWTQNSLVKSPMAIAQH